MIALKDMSRESLIALCEGQQARIEALGKNIEERDEHVTELLCVLKNASSALDYCLLGMSDDPLTPKVKVTLAAVRSALSPDNRKA